MLSMGDWKIACLNIFSVCLTYNDLFLVTQINNLNIIAIFLFVTETGEILFLRPKLGNRVLFHVRNTTWHCNGQSWQGFRMSG